MATHHSNTGNFLIDGIFIGVSFLSIIVTAFFHLADITLLLQIIAYCTTITAGCVTTLLAIRRFKKDHPKKRKFNRRK